jgi:hypothetical protein
MKDGLGGLAQEWIGSAFGSYRGGWTVPRDDPGLVGEREQAALDGLDDLLAVASRQVSAANAACEESVAGEDHFERGEMKADGALGVTRGVKDLGWVGIEAYAEAVREGLIGRSCFRRLDTDPGCLLGHDPEQGKVVFVEKNGRAGEGFKFERSADVIDVGVGDEDLLESEAEGGEAAMDAGDLIAGVDDDGFAGFLVGEDGAVALQRADGKGFENHGFIVGLSMNPPKQMKRQTRLGLPHCDSRRLRYLPGFAGAEGAGCFTSSRTDRAWPERT